MLRNTCSHDHTGVSSGRRGKVHVQTAPSWPQIESNDKKFAEGGVLPSRLRVSSAILYACDAVPRPYGRRGKVMNPVHLAVQRLPATMRRSKQMREFLTNRPNSRPQSGTTSLWVRGP